MKLCKYIDIPLILIFVNAVSTYRLLQIKTCRVYHTYIMNDSLTQIRDSTKKLENNEPRLIQNYF